MSHEYGGRCGGWQLSYFFYVLAIIFLIIAIIVALWNGSRTLTDLDEEQRAERIRQDNVTTWLFLLAIALAALAFVAQHYEDRALVRHAVSKAM